MKYQTIETGLSTSFFLGGLGMLSAPVPALSAPPPRLSAPLRIGLSAPPAGFRYTTSTNKYTSCLSVGEIHKIYQEHETRTPKATLSTKRSIGSNTAGIGANAHLSNTLEDLIAFSNGAGNGARDAVTILQETVHERVKEMLTLLLERKKRSELFERMGLSNQTKHREKYLDPLIHLGRVLKEYEEDTHSSQRYYTSKSGKRILQLMRMESMKEELQTTIQQTQSGTGDEAEMNDSIQLF